MNTSTPTERVAFFVTVALTLIFFFTAVVLSALVPDPNDQQQTLFASCDFAYKAGFGTILGLLGGKLAAS
jgi:hypothetical protein